MTSPASVSIYARYQDDNPEGKFNERLVKWRSITDDPLQNLVDIFAALEVIPGVTFLGASISHDESTIPDDLLPHTVERSRYDLATAKFRLSAQEETKEIEILVVIPKLLDGLFYQLNGGMFFPVLQLVDRGSYVTRHTVTLKTLLMPLVFRRDTVRQFKDTSNAEHTLMVFTVDLFRNRVNVLRYFLAKHGLVETIKFFAPNDELKVVIGRANLPEGNTYVSFPTGCADTFVVADVAWFNGNVHFHGGLVATLVDVLGDATKKIIEDDDRVQWVRRLGRIFTQNTNGYDEKTVRILRSLERILDRGTKRNLVHVTAVDKTDVYAILRWMMREFRTLLSVDSMDVTNKRIRVSEYVMNPLLLLLSEGTYRLLNDRAPSLRRLESLFNPFVYKPGADTSRKKFLFVVDKVGSNRLLRFSGAVNSYDLIPACRFTTRGPQSLADQSGGEVAVKFRGHHPSYVGRIGLSTAAAGDPGMSGSLVPWAPTNGAFFTRFPNEGSASNAATTEPDGSVSGHAT